MARKTAGAKYFEDGARLIDILVGAEANLGTPSAHDDLRKWAGRVLLTGDEGDRGPLLVRAVALLLSPGGMGLLESVGRSVGAPPAGCSEIDCVDARRRFLARTLVEGPMLGGWDYAQAHQWLYFLAAALEVEYAGIGLLWSSNAPVEPVTSAIEARRQLRALQTRIAGLGDRTNLPDVGRLIVILRELAGAYEDGDAAQLSGALRDIDAAGGRYTDTWRRGFEKVPKSMLWRIKDMGEGVGELAPFHVTLVILARRLALPGHDDEPSSKGPRSGGSTPIEGGKQLDSTRTGGAFAAYDLCEELGAARTGGQLDEANAHRIVVAFVRDLERQARKADRDPQVAVDALRRQLAATVEHDLGRAEFVDALRLVDAVLAGRGGWRGSVAAVFTAAWAFLVDHWIVAPLAAACVAALIIFLPPAGMTRGAVQMVVELGGVGCVPRRSDRAVQRCDWSARDDLDVFFTTPPEGEDWFAWVFLQTSDGDITPLRTLEEIAQPLRMRGRPCRAGICWLVGGHFDEVTPGPATVTVLVAPEFRSGINGPDDATQLLPEHRFVFDLHVDED